MSRHTKGVAVFRMWAQSDKDREFMLANGMEPSRLLDNQGAAPLMVGETRVAMVDCQSKFKRGQGHESECAERDANAARLALCWNTHDELLEALTAVINDCDHSPAYPGTISTTTEDKARAAIAKAKGELK